MLFDWDAVKASANEHKHHISFSFASRVFKDRKYITYDVSRPGDGEERWKAVGMVETKLYCVVFTMRGETCWIISARRTNTGEDRAYGVVRS
jgi:uncharacterized DUF497 family protein